MKVGADGQKRLRLVGETGLDPRTLTRLYQRNKAPYSENSLAILENFRKFSCKISYLGGEWCNGSTTNSQLCLFR